MYNIITDKPPNKKASIFTLSLSPLAYKWNILFPSARQPPTKQRLHNRAASLLLLLISIATLSRYLGTLLSYSSSTMVEKDVKKMKGQYINLISMCSTKLYAH